MQVTSLKCELTPYTNCSMTMKAVPFKSFDTVSKMFTKKNCNEKIEYIYLMKKRPECVKLTKNNCVTKWDYDQNGNQVTFYSEATSI